jgi:hypothetical protein
MVDTRMTELRRLLDALENQVSHDTGSDLLPNVPSQPSILEIVDRKTGKVVSGTPQTQTAIVGQKIELQVRTKPPAAMSDICWTVSGQRVSLYTQSATAGTITELTDDLLEHVNVDFYWIAAGSQTVEVAATVQGDRQTEATNYTVLTPTKVSMTSKTGMIQVTPFVPGDELYLNFGDRLGYGIDWTFSATAPAGGEGEIAGTQLINTHITREFKDGSIQTFSSGSRFVLDTAAPYTKSVPIAAGAPATWVANDSPGVVLERLSKRTTGERLESLSGRKVTLKNQFKMYFMYKPKGADSIWVTLGRLNWYCSGETTRTAHIGPPAIDNWSDPTAVSSSKDPSGVLSTELPIWTANFTDL